MSINAQVSIYLNELMYRCNSFNKGFIFLLTDNEYIFNEYSGIKYKKSSVDELIKDFGYSQLEEEKQKYFFTHLYMFFINNPQLNIYDRNACILSSMAAYVENPLDYIVNVLNKFIKNPNPIIKSLKSERFRLLYSAQINKLNKSAALKNYDTVIELNSFSQENKYIYTKIIDSLKNQEIKNIFNAIDLICDIYQKTLESNSQLPEVNNKSSIINSSNKFVDKSNADYEELYKSENDEEKKYSANEFEEVLNKFFNPADDYITGVYDKYRILSERISYESRDCRIIKTILYIMTYVLKNKSDSNFKAAEYMKQLISSDIGWAVGDENNKEPSFYGESDIAKFIYGYYSYMTGKENPYTELINNKIVVNMDYNAAMINHFFKENGLAYMGVGKDKLNEFYNLLVRVRDIIKIIDSPISLTGTYDNFIAGIISSILNSVAMMLDFSISSIVKSLFYVEMIPINGKKYSIANIYNYLNFIKMILESSGDIKNLDYIDRDEFVNCAYDALGINKQSLKKIGYFAYSSELNDLYYSVNRYSDKLAKNPDDMLFTVKNDLKLLYSLIQFGIQKKSFLSGDSEYENKFLYGDEIAINNILNSLTDVEIYYVFSIYNINMWTLDDNLGNISNEEILKFNKKLLFVDEVYNHHDQIFYKVFVNKGQERIYKAMEEYDFTNTNYKTFISNMVKLYKKNMKYNKQQLDVIAFESNDISDIDDFLVRFLPSIIEILKLFGNESVSMKKVAEFIDNILETISEVLFRNLFVNIKVAIQNLVKKHTDDMFNKLKLSKEHEEYETVIDPNFGSTKFVQALDYIIHAIEMGNFNMLSIQDCFKGNISTAPAYYDPLTFDDLIYNHGHNTISKNTFIENILDDYFSTSDGKKDISIWDEKSINTDKNTNNKNNNNSNSNKYNDGKNIIKTPSYTDNKKIYYENGNILIEKNDGTVITVVSKNDKHSSDKSYIEYPSIVEKNLSQDEYKQLIEIRDYIDNITSKELLSLNKQLNEEKIKLKNEMNKIRPNYSVIQNSNKVIQELTSTINDVKKENRILTTESNKETVVIKDFEQDTSKSSENIYSTLDNFFKNKKEILKEVNNIAINNDVVLTNYQITELLK